MEYKPKPILTWDTITRCLCEIRQYQSSLLPFWSVLSFNSVNIKKANKSDMNFLCELTITIPQHSCLFSIAKALSSTVELVNVVTSDSVNMFNYALCAFAHKCLPIELLPSADGWERNWCQMRHRMPELPDSSIPLWNVTHHQGTCLDLFQAIGCFEPTVKQAHQTSKMICKTKLLKSRLQALPLVQDLIISYTQVLKDFEFYVDVAIWKLSNSTSVAIKSKVTLK
jgi:hypothetical protein